MFTQKDEGKGREVEPIDAEMDDGGVRFPFNIDYAANKLLTSIQITIHPSSS
jgi:hypothetical protein